MIASNDKALVRIDKTDRKILEQLQKDGSLTNQQLADLYPNYHYITLTTREEHNLSRKVYVQDLIKSGELEVQTGITLDPTRTHVYICGNPDMIGVPNYTREGEKSYPETLGLVELLESRGFKADHRRDKGNIHFEEYW